MSWLKTILWVLMTGGIKSQLLRLPEHQPFRVVAQIPAEGFGERWADDMRSASAMFLEAGVGFEYVEARQ